MLKILFLIPLLFYSCNLYRERQTTMQQDQSHREEQALHYEGSRTAMRDSSQRHWSFWTDDAGCITIPIRGFWPREGSWSFVSLVCGSGSPKAICFSMRRIVKKRLHCNKTNKSN